MKLTLTQRKPINLIQTNEEHCPIIFVTKMYFWQLIFNSKVFCTFKTENSQSINCNHKWQIH